MYILHLWLRGRKQRTHNPLPFGHRGFKPHWMQFKNQNEFYIYFFFGNNNLLSYILISFTSNNSVLLFCLKMTFVAMKLALVVIIDFRVLFFFFNVFGILCMKKYAPS